MTARDWADDVAAVLYPPPHADVAAMLRVRAEWLGLEQDLRTVYLAGLAAGKREAVTWRDPVADPPEVPEDARQGWGARWFYVLTVPLFDNPASVRVYSTANGWGNDGPPRAWLPIPPPPEVKP